MRMGREAPIGVVVAAAGLLLSGCTGYRLGSTLPASVRSIYVPTFQNRSGEPLLENECTRATIERLQQDGGLRIATPDAANATLSATLAEVKLTPVRYERDQPKAVEEYRMTVAADYELKAAADGSILATGRVEGEAVFTVTGDLLTAKRSAYPAASRDLARRLVSALVEYW